MSAFQRTHFRARRTPEHPAGPTLERWLVDSWKGGWCVSRSDSSKDENTLMEFFDKTIYEHVFWSPTTRDWEAINGS